MLCEASARLVKSQRPPRFGNLSLPAYFDVLSGDSTETYKLYYPETKDYYATLMIQCADLSVTQEDFDSVYLSSIVDSMIASLESDTKNRNEIIEYSKSEKLQLPECLVG